MAGFSEAQRARLLSASGPTAGSSFIAPLNFPGVAYTDREWAGAVRWRLGICFHGPVNTCRNVDLKGEQCGEELDAEGNHAVLCGTGPLRTLRHDCLADIYAAIFEDIGAVARREVYVQELSGTQEAWLDMWGFGVPELPDALLDITVRHPRAACYMPAAAWAFRYAAGAAGGEKEKKYAAAGGRRVIAVAHETWGRLHSSAEELLAACAGIAARRDYRRGRPPGCHLRRWRAHLDAALHRSIAAQLVAARHGLAGRRRRRQAPACSAELESRCPL